MSKFYSQSTRCVYIEGVHTVMPDDVKPITDAHFEQVIGASVQGQVIFHKDGLPYLKDAASLSVDQLAVVERKWRDGEISASEWMVIRHRDQLELGETLTLSADEFQALNRYRQELRDWPQSADFPDQSKRPVFPI